MERRKFLEVIYDKLVDKSRIQTERRVVDVIDSEDGIEVKLEDGTSEHGDILIGCDGVHSQVRELMWRNANKLCENYISADEKRCRLPFPLRTLNGVCIDGLFTALITTYNSLIGVAKTIPGIGTRDMHWVCHTGLSFLILTQPDQTYFFVNWKMPQQMRYPTKAKWSVDEAEKAAQSVAELPISDSVVSRKQLPIEQKPSTNSTSCLENCGKTKSEGI